MSGDHRLRRLGALVDRLERLPASAQREWMLGEVRARAVDVETGEPPRPMRALDPAAAVSSFQAVAPQVAEVGGVTPPHGAPPARVEVDGVVTARWVPPGQVSTPEPVDLAAVASCEPQPIPRVEAGGALRVRTVAPRAVSTRPVLVGAVAHPKAQQPAPLEGERPAIAGCHDRLGLVGNDELLCLGDLPTGASTTPGSLPGEDHARPWVRGLRG